MERNMADTIFTNGRIYTVDSKRSWADSVAIKGNKIIGVGTKAEIECYEASTTEVVDLNQRMMLPGLIEAHAHPIMAGFFKSCLVVDVRQSVEEVLKEVEKYIKENPERDVYFGQGYSEWMFDSNGPQKELLDKICSEKPVLLIGAGLHSGWCNSKALEVAKITRDTLDPDPGAQFFRRKSDGTPNGSLVEFAPVFAVIDAIKPFNEKDIKNSIQRVSSEYSAAGVTSIQDSGSEEYMANMGRPMIIDLLNNKKLRQRIRSCEFVSMIDSVDGAILRTLEAKKEYNSDYFSVDYLKIINDGAFEARSAALLEPYEDGTIIHPMLEGGKLQSLCLEAAAAGLDIAVHAIGDWTTRETLNMAQKLREKGFTENRIANIHCIYIADEDLDRFAEYDVIANTTAIWHHENKAKEEIIGYERANKNFLMNSLYKKDVTITFGSDYPADEYGKEPLKGIEMGVTRQMYGVPEDPILPPYSERLTVKKMIEGYTINAAYQMRMEDKIGSIEVGKYADFVVLEDNLFEIDAHDIHNVRVDMTIFDGDIAYLRE